MPKITIVPDYQKLSVITAEKIVSYIQQKPDAVICLAGGDTPLGTYQQLKTIVKERSIDISQVTFVGLDEWVGMNETVKGSCRYTLNKHLYKPLNIAEENILFFNGKADPIHHECKRITYEMNKLGGINLILLGIGMNGHLGFNEPNVSMDEYAHVVTLDAITRKVSSKYFATPYPVSKGITLGMKTILSADKIISIANGTKKSTIIEKIINGAASPDVPASLLKNHQHVEFIIDEKAAKYIPNSTENFI